MDEGHDDPAELTREGARLLGEGKAPDAVIVLTRAAELRPDHAPTFNALGVALRSVGQVTEAVATIAAAYGVPLPVVATPVGGLVEQMIDGETGVLARSVSAEDFAAALRRLIETPGLYEHCRLGAARYAETHSLECFARALGDVILL